MDFVKSKNFLILFLRVNLAIMLLKIFHLVLLGTLIKGCLTSISNLYQITHLRSSINFATHKIKPGTLTEETVKNNFKGTIERFAASNSAFSFMSSVEVTPVYWKQIWYTTYGLAIRNTQIFSDIMHILFTN